MFQIIRHLFETLQIMATTNSHFEQAKENLKKLQAKREALEEERAAIVAELTAKGENDVPPMGIDTPLVDAEGYPRGDIDVHRARTLRKRFHEIQNDQKALHMEIEQGLFDLHRSPEAEAAELAARRAPKPKPHFDHASGKWVVTNWDGSTTGGGSSISSTSNEASQSSLPRAPVSMDAEETLKPFAKVNGVAPDSPANEAGMKEGDLILKFGNIKHDNHENLQKLAVVVPDAAARRTSLQIVVERPEAGHVRQTLILRPRPWVGRGLLGCHILPYN